jgi:hypothetical protein
MSDERRVGSTNRRLDLLEHALRVEGYSLRPGEGGQGIVVLEHSGHRDRVAMAQNREGRWIYASLPDYQPRTEGEPAERAFARLRACIQRSPSTGSGHEFLEHTTRLRERDAERRAEALAQAPVNRRIYDFQPSPHSTSSPSPEQVAARMRAFAEATRRVDARLPPPAPALREQASPQRAVDSRGALGQRRYDWSQDVRGPAGRDRGPDRGR